MDERLSSLRRRLAEAEDDQDLEKLRSISESLGDSWSEVRSACAKGLASIVRSKDVGLILCEGWTAELAALSATQENWRTMDGLCRALAAFASFKSGPTIASTACCQQSSTTRASATAALIAMPASKLVQQALVDAMRIHEEDEERRAARLAGTLTALRATSPPLFVALPDLKTLLGDRASTVRLAAAGLVEKLPNGTLELSWASWQSIEASLVALDGIISDSIFSKDGSTSSLPVAAEACKIYVGHSQFEVDRAARQLCVSVGAAQVAQGLLQLDSEEEKSKGAAASARLSAGCAFARMCAEMIGRCSSRVLWGDEGADSLTVERRRQAVSREPRENLENVVNRFRQIASAALKSRQESTVTFRLVAFLASTNAPTASVKFRSADAFEESIIFVLRQCDWSSRRIDKLLPEVCTLASCRADDALETAARVCRHHDALAVCLAAALERARRCSPRCLPDALAYFIDHVTLTTTIAISDAPWSFAEFVKSRSALESLVDQLPKTVVEVLALAFAFARASLFILEGPDAPLQNDPLVQKLSSFCLDHFHLGRTENETELQLASEEDEWDDWDDDDDIPELYSAHSSGELEAENHRLARSQALRDLLIGQLPLPPPPPTQA